MRQIRSLGVGRMHNTSLAAKNPIRTKLARLEFQPSHGDIFITDQGPLLIEGPVGAKEMHGYHLDDGLKMFRSAKQQKKALEDIAASLDGFVFIARFGKTIVGYVTFLSPDEYLCWGNKEIDNLLELGAIEVSDNWRRKGIGVRLLEEAFKDGRFEDFIIISTEYYWHWDLEKSGLSIWEYRNMLVDVLSRHGFELWKTNDPDIVSHPANTLMVRTGKRVAREKIIRMKGICATREHMS